MLCPCCGDELAIDMRECCCGARFVGSPLDHKPVKVQQFGPLMIAGALFLLIVAVSLVITKWLAFAGIFAIWSAWRAMRLAHNSPEDYGGYKMATSLLVVTATVGAVASGLGLAYIPQYFDNLKISQKSALEAIMRHQSSRLEEYKLANGAYPDNKEFFKSFPENDYWGNPFKYEPSTRDVSALTERTPSQRPSRVTGINTPQRPVTGFPFANFELRSAGPDGKMDTDDDIVMRDGIFVANTTNREARK